MDNLPQLPSQQPHSIPYLVRKSLKKAFSSMRLAGVSMDLNVIYIMVGAKIKTGDMLYQSDNKKESWEIFQRDYRLGEVDFLKSFSKQRLFRRH